MRNIAAFAKGLLGLLGTKDSGQGIRWMEEALRPALDVERFIGANRRIDGYFPLAGAVLGNNYVATVPTGRLWIIRSGGVSVDAPAASTATFQARVRPPGSPVSVVLGPTADVAASQFRSAPLNVQDLVLEPGTQLGVYLLATTGGPFAISWTAILEEIEA